MNTIMCFERVCGVCLCIMKMIADVLNRFIAWACTLIAVNLFKVVVARKECFRSVCCAHIFFTTRRCTRAPLMQCVCTHACVRWKTFDSCKILTCSIYLHKIPRPPPQSGTAFSRAQRRHDGDAAEEGASPESAAACACTTNNCTPLRTLVPRTAPDAHTGCQALGNGSSGTQMHTISSDYEARALARLLHITPLRIARQDVCAKFIPFQNQPERSSNYLCAASKSARAHAHTYNVV